jgi:predicted component of type VI protein secretion system
LGRVILTLGKGFRKEEESTMSEDPSVEEMAHEVLMRQAKARAERTGESIEEAMEAVLNTEAGAQLRELRDVPHDEESVEEWRVGMARERAEERAQDLGDHLDEPPEHPTHG